MAKNFNIRPEQQLFYVNKVHAKRTNKASGETLLAGCIGPMTGWIPESQMVALDPKRVPGGPGRS